MSSMSSSFIGMKHKDSMPLLKVLAIDSPSPRLAEYKVMSMTVEPINFVSSKVADSRTILNKILLDSERKYSDNQKSFKQVTLAKALSEIEELQIRQRLGYIMQHGMWQEEVDRTQATLYIAQRDIELSRQLFEIGKKYIYLLKKLKGVQINVVPTATGFNLGCPFSRGNQRNEVEQLKVELGRREGELVTYRSKLQNIEEEVRQLVASYLSQSEQLQKLRQESGQRSRTPTFHMNAI